MINTQAATPASVDVAVDDAIYLKWGAGASVAKVESFPSTRSIVVSEPNASDKVTTGYAHVQITLALDTNNPNASLAGLSVDIQKTPFTSTSEGYATITASSATYNDYLNIETAFTSGDVTYYLRVRRDDQDLINARTAQSNPNLETAANLSASLDYSTTNA